MISRKLELRGIATPRSAGGRVEHSGQTEASAPSNGMSTAPRGATTAWCRVPVALCAVVGALAFAASPAAAAADFTWSGATPVGPGALNWSTGTNWTGGTAPTNPVGTLSFPNLSSTACTARPPTDTCYLSSNDLTGLSANALSIDSGSPYFITGNGITLGAGGITAAPSAGDMGGIGAFLDVPLTLSAPQTWSISGGTTNQQLNLGRAVTGAVADSLAIGLSNQALLGLQADNELGAVSVSGLGGVALGGAGKLNATDGSAVTFSGGAGLFVDPGVTGPLTMSGGQIQIGSPVSGGTRGGEQLTVAGAATLDSTSRLLMSMTQAGMTAGTDFSQLSATGTVSLGGAGLTLAGAVFSGGHSSCPTLHVGDVDTLVTTTGSLTGTFAGVPDGTTVTVNCLFGSGTAPTVRINYTASAVTATILTPGGPGVRTMTTLASSPSSPVTNQAVTLTATVTASSGTPSGSVEFDNGATPIPGCLNQPVSLNGSAYTATCPTAFAAASSPEALTATFSPSSSSQQGSTSTVDRLAVGKASTSTALGVSSATPAAGASVTYTATVTPADTGATQPSGSVEFLDGGTPIGTCASQPLTSSAATCTVSYPAAGSHTITATYLADANFDGSTAPAQIVTVQPPPVQPPPVTATAPANSTPPAITGSAIVGQALSATTGTWSGTAPISYAYQWQRCNPSCASIAGATGTSYTLAAADLGARLRVIVAAANAAGSAYAASAQTGVVAPSTAEIKALLARVLKPTGKAAKIAAILKAGGYTISFTALTAGSATVSWYLLPPGAHLASAKHKPVLVATGTHSFANAGTAKLKLKLTAAGKRLLKHAKTVKLTAKASFTPTGKTAISTTKKFKLKR